MIRISGVIGGWEVDPEEIVYLISNSVGRLDLEIDSVGGSVIGGYKATICPNPFLTICE